MLLRLGLLSLLALSPSLAAPHQGSLPGVDSPHRSSRNNKLLLISFDGFRWDYDRDVDTPHLDTMGRDGVRAAYVTPPYLTITSPTHFTLLTGRYIENHGVIHNIWFNTTTQEKKQYYMTQFVDSYWDNGSLPIWITAQRQGLKAGSLHFPGTAATYKGERVKVSQVEPRFYEHNNETDWRINIDKVIGQWFSKEDLDFVSLYFGEPDATGHKYGPDSPERREMVQQVDRTVGYIRDTTRNHGLSDRLNIIITADHGMTTVLRNGLVDEIILSKIPGFDFRDIKFQLVDYGPSGMLLPKEGMLEKVYQALKGGHPHLHVYKKEDMPGRLHYSNHPRLLPLILFADQGYVINGFFPVQYNKGEHGYDNQMMDMKPFFRAAGPDFQKNLAVGPFETVNVYPLMCHLLGIKPEVNDGSLEVTRQMLVPKKDQGSYENRDIQWDVFIGLSSVAGILALVFVVTTAHAMLKRTKMDRRSEVTHEDLNEKESDKQTSF
ncbi:ectonucleotide pyrophosphatase/phosphodiesterase family member 7 [Salmo trutta]|uniref:Ectonucleotide pyrophosphatase/phosphodiesterase 7, tandem duplicate 1 n=1 Tax=Salmo trutta TaxID=8032 RepID=A0A674F7V2_SALTR|nr:ectonucleotide pyrophosphatase/phosphodiesterase family member 7-like [Salmo trutta]